MAEEKQIAQGKDTQIESSQVQWAKKRAAEADKLRIDVSSCQEVEVDQVSRVSSDEGNNGREIPALETKKEN